MCVSITNWKVKLIREQQMAGNTEIRLITKIGKLSAVLYILQICEEIIFLDPNQKTDYPKI